MINQNFNDNPKVRGRPFQKGNKNGKMECHVLDSNGKRNGVKGGVVDPHLLKPQEGTLKLEIEVLPTQKEEMKESENEKHQEVIDFLEFVNGNNTIKIQFSKKSSRNFRLKILINDEIEVKPVSYITKQSAYDSWEMLKRVLKK